VNSDSDKIPTKYLKTDCQESYPNGGFRSALPTLQKNVFSYPQNFMSIKINNKTYKAIIFDVDDTLIDTSKSYDVAIKKTVKNFTSADVSDEHLSLVRTKGLSYGVNNDWNVTWILIQLVKTFPTNNWKTILTNQVIDKINPNSKEYIEIQAFFQNIYLGNPYFNGQGLIDTAEKKMYADNFFPTLKTLGVKIAVVTSRPSDEALYTLKEINALLGEFIESEYFIISADSQNASDQLIAEKPSPEPILEGVQRLNLRFKDCVYIGNSTSDYIAARDAQVDFIQVGSSQIERCDEAEGFNYLQLESVNEVLE
jgi:histidinol-phosphate aminotransferase